MDGPATFNAWGWALRALHCYRTDLSLDRNEVERDALLVVLVGSSQEGKTALALRLLLGNDSNVWKIEKALRGGRKTGESSTAAVTHYSTTGRPLRDEDLDALSLQASDVRRDRTSLTRVSLPGVSLVPASIVDLVGLKAGEKDEDALAREQADRWLDRADLVIFVSALDNIADVVSPHDVHLRRLMYRWQVHRDSCLLVLSSAFETTKSRENQVGATDHLELWNRVTAYCELEVRNQLVRSGGSPEAQLPRVFPVFMKPTNDEVDCLSRQASDLSLAAIRTILRADPVKFAVRSGFSVPMALEREIDACRLDLERGCERIRADVDGCEAAFREADWDEKALLQVAAQLKEKHGKLLAWHKADFAQTDWTDIETQVSLPSVSDPASLDDNKFRTLAEGFRESVESAAEAAISAVGALASSPPIPEMRSRLRHACDEFEAGVADALASLKTKLVDLDDHRIRVWGFLWIDWKASLGSLTEHCGRILAAYSGEILRVVAVLNCAVHNAVSDIARGWEAQQVVAAAGAKEATEVRRRHELRLQELRLGLDRQTAAMNDDLAKMRSRHRRSLQYPAFLASAFRAEWNSWAGLAGQAMAELGLMESVARCQAVSDVVRQICQMRLTSP